MSTSLLIQIADAVVREVNEQEFSQPFTAERIYDPERKLEELEAMRVDVLAGDVKTVPLTRTNKLGTYHVDVAMRQVVNRQDPEARNRMDAMGGLLEEISDYFTLPPRRLKYLTQAATVEGQVIYPYLPSHLRHDQQFTSLLRLTMKAASE
jgi:hypothetical protein